PTTLDIPAAHNFLISEAIRGEGGVLLNQQGNQFMENYHPQKDLAPRDIVTRAVVEELKHGQVYLDIRQRDAKFLKARFPKIYQTCLKFGVDITTDLIPIVPAAHYICGGVKTNTFGETTIKRLFVFGEAACTGVHGANRLASNSLLESVVFGNRAWEKSSKYAASPPSYPEADERKILNHWNAGTKLQERIQDLMWTKAGIIREEKELKTARKELESIAAEVHLKLQTSLSRNLIETQSMVELALLIIKAAYMRKESRGAHFLRDFPNQDDKNWKRHISFTKK
ncbi:MAG: L-aspartate oxidase, partial [Candidatus Ranarchaeia archaeon]